jgi:hypothetical protein
MAGPVLRGGGARISMLGRSEQVRARPAERSTPQAADQLVTILGSMKGAAMKLGQMLSMLDVDMFPQSHRERFRSRLAVLCDQAPKASFAEMRGVLEAELGPLSRMFGDFDEQPSRPRRSARSTGLGCATAELSRSRSSIRASRPRCDGWTRCPPNICSRGEPS